MGGTTNTVGRVLIGNSGGATVGSLNLNGYALTCDFYGGFTTGTGSVRVSNTYGSNASYTTNTGSSPAINIVTTTTATASTLYMDQTNVGTTDKVAITMNNSAGLTLNSGLTLAGLTLTSGNVILNGNTITGAGSAFPTSVSSASSSSYLALNSTSFVKVTSPSTTSTPTVLPIGTTTASTYTPVSFANTSTSGSPSFTVGVAALTAANVVTSASCVPFQWNITSTVNNAQSVITFYSNAATGISSTSQLGVLTTSQVGNYANMNTTLATAAASSNSGTYYTTFGSSASPYSLPANTTANTFVIGANGSVFPLPTITNSPTLTATSATFNNASSAYNIAGSNIASFSSTTGLPPGLSIATSGSATNGLYTAGQITGTPTSSAGSPYTVSVVASNIAGTATASLTYTINNNPSITSATTAVALVGGSFNYTITATASANQFTATIPSTNSLSSSLSLSGATISGTLAAGTAGTYSIPLTATNTTTSLSCTSCPTLTLTVLDVPTVTSISPTTSKVDTITSGNITLTVNGTNFVSGFSTVTWAGSNLATTYVSASQLTAVVPASLLAHTVSSSTAAVGVTNAGTNASPTTPTSPSTSSATTNYTLSVATPTVSSTTPAATLVNVASTITVTGTNFISGVSAVKFNGSTTGVTTTFVSSTTLTATISSSLVGTAGSATIGVTNSGAGLTPSSGTTTFTIYNDGTDWTFANTGVPSVNGNVSATTIIGSPTYQSMDNNSYATIGTTSLAYCPSGSAASQTWPNDGSPSINNSGSNIFNGISTSASSRYIEFDVKPISGYNYTVNHILIPFTNNTGSGTLSYVVAYSLDGFTSTAGVTTISAAGTSGNPGPLVSGGASINFVYATPIIVQDGKTLSVRVIYYTYNKNQTLTNATVNLSNVIIAGTTSASYASPVITSQIGGTINGDATVTYTTASPLYTFVATTVGGHTNTLSLVSGLSSSSLVFNAASGTITGKDVTTGGTYTLIFKADNGNLFPVYDTISFVVSGIPLTPTINTTGSTISPTSASADGAQFTLTVNGTNFVSGKSQVFWNTTGLTTTYVNSTKLTAVVPASFLLASNFSSSNLVPITVYNTGAATPTSNAVNFTVNNLTPTIYATSPAAAVAGGSSFTINVYGTNYTTGSAITWGGTSLTTTLVSSTQLSATVPSANITSTGTYAVGVTNTLAGSGSSSAITKSFVVGNAEATWFTGSSNTPTIVGNLNSTITTTPTLTGVIASYSSGQILCGTSSGTTTYPADGASATVNSTFTGLAASTATASTSTATRSVDYYISPTSGYSLSLASIAIPVSVSGGSNATWYAAAYSSDTGKTFTEFTSSTTTGGANAFATSGFNASFSDVNIPSSGTTFTTLVPATPISVNNNASLIVRVIAWRKNASNSTSTTVNFGPVTMVGNTTQIPTPSAPTVGTLADDNAQVDVSFSAPSVIGTSAITSYKVYAYANGSSTAATSVSANVSSLTLPYHINVTGLTNNTSYQFKVSATNASGEGTLSALSNAVTPSNTTTWSITSGLGSWDHGDPNDGTQNATINGNFTATYPLNCLKLTVNSGYTLTNNSTFTVTGATITNNGIITGTGTLILNSSAAQTISGNGTVANLTINTSAGVTITSGSNNLGVTGVLTLQAGQLTTNGNLTFKSTSITNSGVLAAIDGTTNVGSITGTVTVERYIPAGYRGYRDLAPEVYNAGTIYNNWQEGGKLPSSSGYQDGYGIFITGPSATDATLSDYASGQKAANGTTGLDYSINGFASAYSFINSRGSFYLSNGKIDSIYNTIGTNLYPFTGYRVLVRGDRSFNLATSPIINYPGGLRMYKPTTLRATGQLVTGTVTYNTSGVTNASVGTGFESSTYGLNSAATTISNGKITAGISMVANPYVCPVSWSAVYSNSVSAGSNINATYYTLNPTYSATGSYDAFNASTGGSANGDASFASDYIQAGQAFFILNATSSPTPKVVFNETAKRPTATKTNVFGATVKLSKLYVSLAKETNATYTRTGSAAIAFKEGFTNNNFGPQDALQINNSADNVSIADKGINLSIDGRLPATTSDAIAVKIGNPSATSYQLSIDASAYSNNGFAPVLYDAYKNTTTPLASAVTTINFTIDSKTASSYENRFSIIFNPSALAIKSIVASTTLINKVATITWNTVGEKGVSYYEVQKSTDGTNFNKIGTATAKNTASAAYTATDNSFATNGSNYYRIKAVTETGAVSYSNVAKLTTNNTPLTTIYPNPLTGKTLNVSLTNVDAGKYVVSIFNILGQKVTEQAITHNGGSNIHAININNALAAGIYSVAIRKEESGVFVCKTSLSVQK